MKHQRIEEAAVLFICHPTCTTCDKARAFLKARQLPYVERDIRLENPTKDELKAWLKASGLPLKRFFNTSGMLYRERGLTRRLPGMTEDEQLDELASSGMLVRRPILLAEGKVLVGFDEKKWAEALG